MVPIESCKIFAGLPPDEMEMVQKAAQELYYPAGTVVFCEGDPGNGLYIVKSGAIEISTQVAPDTVKVFAIIKPGDIFGEMAVIENEKRSATATAREDSWLYFIPQAEMLRMLECSPKITLGLVREISRRLREFNKHYIQEVLQAERLALVGRFARSIVHDIKNPLNIIGIAADMIAAEEANLETRKNARTRIRRQVERITNMVNELLEFTRSSQTSFILNLMKFDEFVIPLVAELRAETSLKGVTIELENQPPSVKVAMAPQRLSRVFFNIIHNATDVMPNGGKIIIRFKVEGQSIVTEIEDTGPGLSAEAMEHLFEPFFTHGKAHGTGLGLSICKRIIEDHNGFIKARNSTNGGAIFYFSLPCQS